MIFHAQTYLAVMLCSVRYSRMHAPSRRPSFLSGAGILTVSALIVKVIGLFYRIPLLRVLGTEGMGYFNAAYELYALFCVIATTGLPVAMSVLISARNAEDGRGLSAAHARRVFRVSLGTFFVIGLVGTALLWGLSAPFAALLGSERSAICMRAIAPTVLLICLSSALRGYFQGHRNMTPTAISQIVEASGKLVLGLLLAGMARERGCDLSETAAWAVLGLTAGTALSLAYLVLSKWIRDRVCSFHAPIEADPTPVGQILRALAATAVPVTVGAGVIASAKCLDLILIHRRLGALGYTAETVASVYGCYSTLAVPVFNILPSLATSVSLSAVPALAAAFARGQEGVEETRRTATSALRVTLLVSIPAALGLSVFSRDILSLLFSGQPAAVSAAAPWLSCLALSVPAACLVTVTGGMLQAAGYARRPVISMLVGVALKTVLSYILLANPRVGMMGAPIGSLVCDTVIVALNILFIARNAPAMLPHPREAPGLFLWPTGVSILSLAAVRAGRAALGRQAITPGHTLLTVLSVMVLYGVGLLPCLLLRTRKHDLTNRKKDCT